MDCTHGLMNEGPGYYCRCGRRAPYGRCPCGCAQPTAAEHRARRRRRERLAERAQRRLFVCSLADGTCLSGGLKERRYVMARTEKEALRKIGWKRSMGWDQATAHPVEVTP